MHSVELGILVYNKDKKDRIHILISIFFILKLLPYCIVKFFIKKCIKHMNKENTKAVNVGFYI